MFLVIESWRFRSDLRSATHGRTGLVLGFEGAGIDARIRVLSNDDLRIQDPTLFAALFRENIRIRSWLERL